MLHTWPIPNLLGFPFLHFPWLVGTLNYLHLKSPHHLIGLYWMCRTLVNFTEVLWFYNPFFHDSVIYRFTANLWSILNLCSFVNLLHGFANFHFQISVSIFLPCSPIASLGRFLAIRIWTSAYCVLLRIWHWCFISAIHHLGCRISFTDLNF